MTMTSDYDEIDELDEPEQLVGAEPATEPGKPGWEWTPRRKAVAAGAVGFVALVLVGKGCGGDEKAETPATTPTTMSVNPLDGFPTPSPLVASTLRAEDLGEFANKVRSAVADGTSVCDVFFGIVAETHADGTKKVSWALTTPNMQKRSEVGVQLPSSKWPTRAFYGSPCNVVDRDVPLATTTTVKAG